MNIGERIKKRREEIGLTLEEVGDYINVNKATVQRYESGNIDIKRTIAIKLAEILQTTPAYIMGWSDNASLIINVGTDNLKVSGIEKDIILAYRKSDNIGKAVVLRSLGLDEKNSHVKGDVEKMA